MNQLSKDYKNVSEAVRKHELLEKENKTKQFTHKFGVGCTLTVGAILAAGEIAYAIAGFTQILR